MSKTYMAWQQVLRQRKTIQVCEAWMAFIGFLCSVGKCPGANYSLRRLDRSRGFFPGNVAWVKHPHGIN